MHPGASWPGFKSEGSPLISPLNEITKHFYISMSSSVKWEVEEKLGEGRGERGGKCYKVKCSRLRGVRKGLLCSFVHLGWS